MLPSQNYCSLEVSRMKKLIAPLLLAAAAFALWRKLASDRAEQDLWAEATDNVG